MTIHDQFNRKLAEPAPTHLRDESVQMETPVHGLRRIEDFINNGFDPNLPVSCQADKVVNMPSDLQAFFNLRYDHGCLGIRKLELMLDDPSFTDQNYATTMAVVEAQDLVATCARQFSLLAMRNVMLHASGKLNEATSARITGLLEASAKRLTEVQSVFQHMSRQVEREEVVTPDLIRGAYSGVDSETISSLRKQIEILQKENAMAQIEVPTLSKLSPEKMAAAIVFIRECFQATKDTLQSAQDAVMQHGSQQQIAMQKGQKFQLDSLIRASERQIAVYENTGEVTDGLQAAFSSLYKHHNSGTHAAMMLSIIMDNGIEAIKDGMEHKLRAEVSQTAPQIDSRMFAEAVEKKAQELVKFAREAGEKGIAELTVVVQKDQENVDDIVQRLQDVNALPRSGFIQESSKKNALVTDNGDMRMLQVYVPPVEFLEANEEGQQILAMLNRLHATPEMLSAGIIVFSETLTSLEQSYSQGEVNQMQMIEAALNDHSQITNSILPEVMADVKQLQEKLAARDAKRQAKRAMLERISTVFGMVENSALTSKKKTAVPITSTFEDLHETYMRFFATDDPARFDMLDVLHKTDAVKEPWLDANAVFSMVEGGLPFGDRNKIESFAVLDRFMKRYSKSLESGRLQAAGGGEGEAQALWLDWFDYDSDQELSKDEHDMATVLAHFGRLLTIRLLHRGFGRDYFPLLTAPESPHDLTH